MSENEEWELVYSAADFVIADMIANLLQTYEIASRLSPDTGVSSNIPVFPLTCVDILVHPADLARASQIIEEQFGWSEAEEEDEEDTENLDPDEY